MMSVFSPSRWFTSGIVMQVFLHLFFLVHAHADGNAASLARSWEFHAGGPVVAPLTVTETSVYFGSKDRRVYALDRMSGRLLWEHETGGMIRGGPAVYGETVYVGSTDHALYALQALDGHMLWRFPTVGAIMGEALATETRVFFGSNDHHLYCLDRRTGELAWRFKSGDTIECLPAMDDRRVFLGSGDNRIYALEKETGRLIWEYETGASVDGGFLIVGNHLFAASQDGFVYALNTDTGRLVWRCQTKGTLETFPVSGPDGRVYVGGGHRNGRVSCVDHGGRLVWQKNLGGSVFGPLSMANGLLWGGSSSGVLKGLRPKDGVDSLTIVNGAAVLGGIRAYGHTLYWSDDLARVHAWRTDDGCSSGR